MIQYDFNLKIKLQKDHFKAFKCKCGVERSRRVYSPSCLLVCAYDTKASKGSSSTHQGERSQHWVANHLSKTSVVCLSETVKGATRLLRLSIFGEIPELRISKVLTWSLCRLKSIGFKFVTSTHAGFGPPIALRWIRNVLAGRTLYGLYGTSDISESQTCGNPC